jgi:CRP-like cAMP-binding protein
VPDFLDSARRDIESRLSDLRDETKRLEKALDALRGQVTGNGRRRARRAASSGRARTASRKSANGRRRRRGRRGGTRSDQAHKLVQSNPGISIADLAKEMKITPNYLYRVMPQLQKEGKVRKQGKGWHPAGG